VARVQWVQYLQGRPADPHTSRQHQRFRSRAAHTLASLLITCCCRAAISSFCGVCGMALLSGWLPFGCWSVPATRVRVRLLGVQMLTQGWLLR